MDNFFESGVQSEKHKDYNSAAKFFVISCKNESSRYLAFSHILELTVKNLIDCSYLEKLFLEDNELLRKAERQAYSDPDISNLLGTLYYFDSEIIEKDFQKAAEFFRNAALNGNIDAPYYLGIMFEFGQGVEQNDKEAVKWYRMAYKNGVKEAGKSIKRLVNNL